MELACLIPTVDVESGRPTSRSEASSGPRRNHFIVSVVVMHIHCVSTDGALGVALHDLLLELIVLALAAARNMQATGCVDPTNTIVRVLPTFISAAQWISALVGSLVVVVVALLMVLLLHVCAASQCSQISKSLFI